jgi:hypothetical protein
MKPVYRNLAFRRQEAVRPYCDNPVYRAESVKRPAVKPFGRLLLENKAYTLAS